MQICLSVSIEDDDINNLARSVSYGGQYLNSKVTDTECSTDSSCLYSNTDQTLEHGIHALESSLALVKVPKEEDTITPRVNTTPFSEKQKLAL